MKLFKKLIFIFLSIGALISCDGMDATYKEFIEEGPIVYIGKVDSLLMQDVIGLCSNGRNYLILVLKRQKYSGKTERSLLNYN